MSPCLPADIAITALFLGQRGQGSDLTSKSSFVLSGLRPVHDLVSQIVVGILDHYRPVLRTVVHQFCFGFELSLLFSLDHLDLLNLYLLNLLVDLALQGAFIVLYVLSLGVYLLQTAKLLRLQRCFDLYFLSALLVTGLVLG
jgi:hypothetical protein